MRAPPRAAVRGLVGDRHARGARRARAGRCERALTRTCVAQAAGALRRLDAAR
jgi:hypothetical protein